MIEAGKVAGHVEPTAGRGQQGVARLIAKRASKSGRAKRPIQVRAQVLRGLPTRGNATFGFFLPAEDPQPIAEGRSRSPHGRQSDVRRAVAAAEEAGLQDYRIEIAPDGTIAIVVGGREGTDDPICGS